MGSESMDRSGQPSSKLTLYYFPQSYYSQRVLIALQEKNIPFKKYILDNMNYEMHAPWYMKMSPAGQAPVLKDEDKVIPDSLRIIDYLEDNFSNGDVPRLYPPKGTEEYAKVRDACDRVNALCIDVLTYGIILNPELTSANPLPSFIRNAFASMASKKKQVLEEFTKQAPELKDAYQKKIDDGVKFMEDRMNKDLIRNYLKQAENVVDFFENELAARSPDKADWWLCTKSFGVADIFFGVLLCRLSFLKQENLWKESRPHVAAYFVRILEKPSFKAALASANPWVAIRTIWRSSPTLQYVSAALAIAILSLAGYKLMKMYNSP